MPDVKELQARYEYLMDTIKERDSEVKPTDDSLKKSDMERSRKSTYGSNNARTMKWKKSERGTIDEDEL